MQATPSTRQGRFSGKTVVVTGASSGIGLAAARLFAEEGARVVLFARGEGRLRAAEEATRGVAVAGDVTEPADLQRLFTVAGQDGGGVDVLLANAAAARLAPIADCAEHLVDEVVGVNLKGTFSTLRHALPVLNVNRDNPCRGHRKARAYVDRGVVDPVRREFTRDYTSRIGDLVAHHAGEVMGTVDDLHQQVFRDHPVQLTRARVVEEVLAHPVLAGFFDLSPEATVPANP